jgi:hypothetical protein
VDGSIESVNVLRSASFLLDKAATDALKQWRYAPLVIAELPMRFVVTATFNFGSREFGEPTERLTSQVRLVPLFHIRTAIHWAGQDLSAALDCLRGESNRGHRSVESAGISVSE